MSNYKIVNNVSKNTDTFFNVNVQIDNDKSFNSTFDTSTSKVKADINKSLNKYDFYDALLDEFIKEYKRRMSKEMIKKFARDTKKDEKKCKIFIKEKYLYLIKYYIDENYFTVDMAMKLAKNGLINAIPNKFDKEDFMCDYKDEEEVLGLKNKYRKIILKDEIRYTKEEKRSLEFERERVNKELDEMLKEMAALSNYRNNINESIRKVKER